MRLNNFLLLLTLLIVPMSGCLGFGDEEKKDTCEEHEHDDGTMESHGACGTEDDHDDGHHDGNVTNGGHDDHNDTQVPNVLPNGTLSMMKADGTYMDAYSFIKAGETVTFSANGSFDPDGQIDLIGLTATDSNNTRTVQLMDGGVFTDQTMQFDHVGAVNVTMRILDDRGEGIVLYYSLAVNQVKDFTESKIALAGQSGCKPLVYMEENSLVANQIYSESGFTVGKGAQWFEVTSTGGVGSIVICDADNTDLGSGTTSASTTQQDWAAAPTGYYAAVYPAGPGQSEMTFTITVHYEDKPVE